MSRRANVEFLTDRDMLMCVHNMRIIATASQSCWKCNEATPLTVQDLENARCQCTAPTPCVKLSMIAGGVSLESNGQQFVVREKLTALTEGGLVRVSSGGKSPSFACASTMAEALAPFSSSADPPSNKVLYFTLRADRGDLSRDAIDAKLFVIVTIVQKRRTFHRQVWLDTRDGAKAIVVTDLNPTEEAWAVISTSVLRANVDDWSSPREKSFVSFSAKSCFQIEGTAAARWKPTYEEMLKESGEGPGWRETALANRLPDDAHKLPEGVVVRIPFRVRNGDDVILKPRFPSLLAVVHETGELQEIVKRRNHFDRSNLEARLLLAWTCEQLSRASGTQRSVEDGTAEVVRGYGLPGFKRLPSIKHKLYKILLDQHDAERKATLEALAAGMNRLRALLEGCLASGSRIEKECEELALTTPWHRRFCRPKPGKPLRGSRHPATEDDAPAELLLGAMEEWMRAHALCQRYRRTGRPLDPPDPHAEVGWAKGQLQFLTESPVIGLLRSAELLVGFTSKIAKETIGETALTLRLAQRTEKIVLLGIQFSQRYGLELSWVHTIRDKLISLPICDREGKLVPNDFLVELSRPSQGSHLVGRIEADAKRINSRLGVAAGSLGLILFLHCWLKQVEDGDKSQFPALEGSQGRKRLADFSWDLGAIEMFAQFAEFGGKSLLARTAPGVMENADLLRIQRYWKVTRMSAQTARALGIAGMGVSLISGIEDLRRGHGWLAASAFSQAGLGMVALLPGCALIGIIGGVLIPMLLESMHRSEEEKQLIELLEKTEFGTSYESHLSKVFGHDATRRDWADEYYRHDTRDKPPAKGLRELLHLLQSLRFQFEFAKIKTIYEKYHRVDGVVLRLAHRLDAGPTIRSRFVPPDHWNMPEIHVSSFTEPTGDGKAFKVSIELSTDPAAAAKLIDIHQSPSTFVGPCALLLKRHGHEKQHVLIVWADRQDSFSCHLKLEKVEPGAVTTIVLAPGTLFRPPPPPSSYPTFSVGEDTRGPRLKVADPDGALEEKERKTNPNDPARVSFVEDKIEVEMP